MVLDCYIVPDIQVLYLPVEVMKLHIRHVLIREVNDFAALKMVSITFKGLRWTVTLLSLIHI